MNILIPQDKANHFVYGAVAYPVCLFATQWVGGEYAKLAALGLVALLGLAKEGFDWYANRRNLLAGRVATHGVDPLDGVATLAGGVACWISAIG